MHPVLTHVPPKSLRSTSATLRPDCVSRPASEGPAWPAPTMMESNFLDMRHAWVGAVLRPNQSVGACHGLFICHCSSTLSRLGRCRRPLPGFAPILERRAPVLCAVQFRVADADATVALAHTFQGTGLTADAVVKTGWFYQTRVTPTVEHDGRDVALGIEARCAEQP